LRDGVIIWLEKKLSSRLESSKGKRRGTPEKEDGD